MSPTRSHRFALSIGTALVLAGAAACGSNSSGGTPTGSDTTSSSSSSVDSAAAAMVPTALKNKGTLTVGSDTTYAPSEFIDTDGKTIVGFDVDLFKAVAAKLGLKANFQTADFGAIIPGVQSGKYDIGVSSFTINKDRLKQATMVSYYQTGTEWVTQKGNPSGITPDNACGKHVAVQKATIQVTDLQQRSKKCTNVGKPGIGIDQFAAQDAATTAAVSGKDDAVLADSLIMIYAIQQSHGQLQETGSTYGAAPYGYDLPKGSTAFGNAIVKALQDLMQDGTYKRILDKWGVSAGAITNPTVDPPVTS